MSIIGAEVDGDVAAALPVRSTVGHGRDSYVKVGANDWRRVVGEGYVGKHPLYDNQMAGTSVLHIGTPEAGPGA